VSIWITPGAISLLGMAPLPLVSQGVGNVALVLSDEGSDATFSVGELAEVLTMWTRRAFPREVWVRGEIRNLSRPASGHVYFSLVECGTDGQVSATVRVMMSRVVRPEVNALLVRTGGRMRMTDGVEVRLRGRVDWFTPTGQLNVRMSMIDPEYTLGRLVADRDRLLRSLEVEGLLHRNRSLPMPAVPLTVGLVTAAGSAAEADFVDELSRSGLGFRVLRATVPVQGPDAPVAIAAALASVAARRPDVVALVRGGGARTDLAAFDHEVVARAVAGIDVPVLTGIGHEIDRSVADEVAHLALKTPTACAHAIVRQVREFTAALDRRWHAVATLASGTLDREQHALARHARHAATTVAGAMRVASARIDDRHARLVRSAPRAALGAARHVEGLDARVRALDPSVTLARGWSITRRADGSLVRAAGDVAPGDELHTTVAAGVVRSTVIEVHGAGEVDRE
jgi:exodeoxyribonuclease VII large subunit